MNWVQFILWLTAVYLLYYVANILLDITGSKRSLLINAQQAELRFTEDIEPITFTGSDNDGQTTKQQITKPEPEVVSSGGVAIKELFTLSRREAIHYTMPVSF